ncbi:MAG: nucleoside deaminase [Candidatus Aminicenantes bacterium]|nr:MAG: nucleoside deaminase [Candidatus Aminicenantes bacterium]
MEKDELFFMKQALALAELAYQAQEVPVGAVVVLNNEMIGKGYNAVIKNSDPTAHAEMVALREAGEKIGNYRVLGADVYVTLEPCLMCYSAMVQARVRNLFFGALDAKTGIFSTGAFAGIKNIFNHTIAVKSGIMSEPSSKLLQDFFREQRERRGAGVVERGGLENR